MSTPLTPTDASFDDVVPGLREHTHWVCWRTERRDGTPTKVPLDPATGRYASVDDPDTWASVELARRVADTRTDVDGIGFVFAPADDFVGIDLDACLELATPGPGVVPTDRARTIVDRLDSYTELSPSHTGLHVLARGDAPTTGAKTGGVELYDRRRFFTVTGTHVQGTPRHAAARTDALQAVYEAYLADHNHGSGDTTTEAVDTAASTDSLDTDDLDRIVRLASNADNGDRFERLWNGSTAGYPSHSEADMALCTFLAFWTGGDPGAMDTLFRRSGLMRPKWDAQRGDSTYGERTIARALTYVDDYYRSQDTS